MRTALTPSQLADPHMAAAERNLRVCVHCGMCTATCPTYVLIGDERDGPRGRIVMMQQMLESGGAPTAEAVRHIDRCLSCLGCRTACPSSVDYARLVDAARAHIHTHFKRPWKDRALRAGIAYVMARPGIVKFAMALARFFSPIATRLPGRLGLTAKKSLGASRIAASDTMAEDASPKATSRVALMPGCVQRALAPAIDRAAKRVLARRGVDAADLKGAGCCGALAHHLGRRAEAKAWARRAIMAFEKECPFDAVMITATGCAAHLADYGHLFADEPEWRARAEAFAAGVKDFAELATPKEGPARTLRLAYHAPCSLQHGLKRERFGKTLLQAAGYPLSDIPEGHLCCGSAGSYSLLEPEIAGRLRARKLENIATLDIDAVASANIGCLMHLAGPDAPPVIHPAELIDWAEGGPKPAALASSKADAGREIKR